MWEIKSEFMEPLIPSSRNGTPGHSQPYQNLPEIYVQNASLEIAVTSVVRKKESISGDKILPFFPEGYGGFDINTPNDWIVAEQLVKQDSSILPKLAVNHRKGNREG